MVTIMVMITSVHIQAYYGNSGCVFFIFTAGGEHKLGLRWRWDF